MDKMKKVMGEFSKGTLHSGSESGPKVKNRKQAIAIALSEAREAGANIPNANQKMMRMHDRVNTG